MFTFYDCRESGKSAGDTPERWDKFFESIRSEAFAKGLRSTPEYRLVRRFVKPSSTVLEAGCGPGYWARVLASEGHKAEGLDFSKRLIDRLKAVEPTIAWHLGDLRAMPIEEGRYDLVLCWGVVEHFEEGPEASLRDLYRVLAPGGHCFVSVPYLNRLRRMTFKGETNRDERRTVFNQNYFSAEEFRDLVEDTGFIVCEQLPIGQSLEVALPPLARLRPKIIKRALNRLLVPALPTEATAHMLLVIARKPTATRALGSPA